MPSSVNVSTAAELADNAADNNYAYKDITIVNDIDYNIDPYYMWNNDFINCVPDTLYINGGYTVTEDGKEVSKRHILSNIYVQPNKIFIKNSAGCNREIKNLEFEVILNNAMFYDAYNKANNGSVTKFINCVFNIRVYNLGSNPVFRLGRYTEDDFINCVFNIYITNAADIKPCIFKATDNAGHIFDYYLFESCIFKIRNSSKMFYCIFNADQTDAPYLDNCAIFLNDINGHPSYDSGYVSGHGWNSLGINGNNKSLKMNNSYIASFGQSDGTKIRICVGDNRNSLPYSSCFCDSDKINPVVHSGGYSTFDTNVISRLTTEQCKTPSKLSEIGYIFCEEV